MRVGNSSNFSNKTEVEIRQARANARNGAKKSSSSGSVTNGKTSLTEKASSVGKTTTTGALYNAQMKKSFTAIKAAAATLQDQTEVLLADGADSLFTTKEKGSNAEGTAERTKLTKAISTFAEDYNALVGKMSGADESVNQFYLQNMKSLTAKNKSDLKDAGITLKSDGTLSVKKSTLEQADLSDLQTLFGSDGGFADKVSKLSQKIESNADASLKALAKSSSSSYNQYGINRTSSSGRLFNTKG